MLPDDIWRYLTLCGVIWCHVVLAGDMQRYVALCDGM